MGEGFQKHKKSNLRSALVKSVLLGVSCAFFCVGTVLLACKLAFVRINAAYYILIALSAAAIVGAPVFFSLHLSDKRLAVSLDETHHLGERVQTALAFEGAYGEVVELQRADTDARLAALPVPKLTFAKLWQYCLVALLSVALLSVSIFLPVKKAEGATPPVVDPPFTLTEAHKIKLNQVIANLEKTELSEETKAQSVATIQTLLTDLAEARVTSEMRALVVPAVNTLRAIFAGATSYASIATSLAAVGQKALAEIIADGINLYRRFYIVEFEDVSKTDLKQAVDDATSEQFEQLFEALADTAEGVTVAVAGALMASGAPEEDELYAVLKAFSARIPETETEKKQFTYALCDAVSFQTYTVAVKKYACNKVLATFGLPPLDDESFTLPGSFGGPSEDDEPPASSGGYGRGDVLYGSDDEVYDPDTGEYVKYGELLNKYYALVQEFLRSGELTEEQMDIVRAYFDILFSGVPAEN